MNDRDAMVLTLMRLIDRPQQAAVPVRAKAERQKAGARKGIAGRLATALFRRRAAMLSPIAKSSRRIVAAASRNEFGGGAARAVATPWGVLAALALATGVVSLRVASGQPLEGTGEAINAMVLGDMDDESRARTATRNQFTGNDTLCRLAANAGGVTQQMAGLRDALYKENLAYEKGATLWRRKYPVDSMLDLIIVKLYNAAKKRLGGAESDAKLKRLGGALAEYQADRPPFGFGMWH